MTINNIWKDYDPEVKAIIERAIADIDFKDPDDAAQKIINLLKSMIIDRDETAE